MLPAPTLIFGTTIRIAESYSSSPGAVGGDGCIAAEAKLSSGGSALNAVSKVVFDGVTGRLRQSNTQLQHTPAVNLTQIGRWDLRVPTEWDLTTSPTGATTCTSEREPFMGGLGVGCCMMYDA